VRFSMTIRVGDEVGPYKVHQLLGRGSFSTVLLGQDPHHPHRRFALKVIACDHMDPNVAAEAMKEAIAEAQLLQRLRHPHIVSCHQLCWDIERCAVWLALDFMDGGDLQRLIEGWRGFSVTVAMNPGMYQASLLRRVLAALGSALIYTHSQGVLHRDVKPSNVLLSRDFRDIKLADFGISKILAATGNAHSTVGTPYYLSPEIVSGEPYGPASDAWAVGVCLYELVAMQRPFRAENQLALACQIAQQIPEPLPEGCAADIVQVVSGLLIKDPLARLELKAALSLLHEPQLLPPCLEETPAPMPSHCCAIGVIGRRSHPPKHAFGTFERECEQPAEKRGRRRWPRFRLGSRSRRVAASSHEGQEDATQSQRMKLVSSPCLAGHSLQQLSATPERFTCDTCHTQVSLGTALWGCRTCSFSLCEPCSQNEAEWTLISLDDL
jgi:serine/threonine protein kinase